MKLLLALGNPGDTYRDTRHNVGWWLADHLAVRWSLPESSVSESVASTRGRVGDEIVVLARPLTYMNRSGRVVPRLLEAHGVEPEAGLLVLVDDVSLPPGKFRIRARGSAGGHNGLASIEGALDSRDYARLRIGVGAPGGAEVDLAAWVLAQPGAQEESALLERMDSMAEAVECWLAEGVEPAMNRFN